LRLLLDTHIAIWACFADTRLPKAGHMLLSEAETVFVSAASIWEIAIKHALRGNRPIGAFPITGHEAIGEFERAGFSMLAVTPGHAAMVGSLPRHHGDPFDRLLVAQARAEPLRLVTADRALEAYGEIITIV